MHRSILVADDNASVRALLVRLIRRANPEAEVVDVASGKAALEQYSRCTPNVVVVDHGLPDIDGFYVLQQLRLQQPRPYLIVITGDPTLEQEALNLGADQVWLKPMDITILLQQFAYLLPVA